MLAGQCSLSVLFLTTFARVAVSTDGRQNSCQPGIDDVQQILAQLEARDLNGRMIILLCKYQCRRDRQIKNWVEFFNDYRSLSRKNQTIKYYFCEVTPNVNLSEIGVTTRNLDPAIIYSVGGKRFIHRGGRLSEKAFIKFLDGLENISKSKITKRTALEEVINEAQICNNHKYLILFSDIKRCPMPHFDNVLRSLKGSVNHSFYEISRPLSPELLVEVESRFEEFPSTCGVLVFLQNNGYMWIPVEKDVHEIRSMIEGFENGGCEHPSDSWTLIKNPITDVERTFREEEIKSRELEWNPSYIMVGATGGIAVIALAISIFWGLNGTAFITK